jgi:hypothetical protein
VDYKEKFQYLIIQTENDYFQLILIDQENGINIRDQDKSEISLTKLKFSPSSIICLQNYNSEDVIVNLTTCENNFNCSGNHFNTETNYANNTLDIYHVFELNKPIFSINFSAMGIFNILNVFLFEKVIIVVCEESEFLSIKILSTAIKLLEQKEKKEEEMTWCNQNYNLLESNVLYEQVIPLEKIKTLRKLTYNQLLNETYSMKTAINNNPLDMNIIKKYKLLKDKIKFHKNKTNPNSKFGGDRVIAMLLTEHSLYGINFKGGSLNFNNIQTQVENSQQQIINYKSYNWECYVNKLSHLDISYKSLRKVELLNYALNGKILEHIDDAVEMLSKTNFNQFVILRLLWTMKYREGINTFINKLIEEHNLNIENDKENLFKILSEYLEMNILQNKIYINFEFLISWMRIKMHNDLEMLNKFLNDQKLCEMIKNLKINESGENEERKIITVNDRMTIVKNPNSNQKKSPRREDNFSISSLEGLDISNNEEEIFQTLNIFNRGIKEEDESKNVIINLQKMNEQKIEENVTFLGEKKNFKRTICQKIFLLFLIRDYRMRINSKNMRIKEGSDTFMAQKEENLEYEEGIIDEKIRSGINKLLFLTSKDKMIHLKLILFNLIINDENINERLVEEMLILKYKLLNFEQITGILYFIEGLLNCANIPIFKSRKIQIHLEPIINLFFSLNIKKRTDYDDSIRSIPSFYKNCFSISNDREDSYKVHTNLKFLSIIRIVEITFLFYFCQLKDQHCFSNKENEDIIGDFKKNFSTKNGSLKYYLEKLNPNINNTSLLCLKSKFEDILKKMKDPTIPITFKEKMLIQQMSKNTKININN